MVALSAIQQVNAFGSNLSVETPEIDLSNSNLRSKVLIALSILLVFACTTTAARNFVAGTTVNDYLATSQSIFALVFAILAFKIIKGQERAWFGWVIVYSYLGLIIVAVLSFGIDKTVVRWLYSIPVVSFFILSFGHGLLLSAAVLVFMTYLKLDFNLAQESVNWYVGINNLLLPYCIVTGVAGVYEKARQQQKRELTEFALTDALTGCYNRLALKSMFNWYQKSKQDFSLLLLDLDHFKRLNDLYGHDTGDHVLLEFSNFCIEQLGAEKVFRIGGEEFVLILNGIGEESIVRAESIRSQVQNQDFLYADKRIYLTFSAGLVQDIKSRELKQVLKHADSLLYRAKGLGRNRTVYQNG